MSDNNQQPPNNGGQTTPSVTPPATPPTPPAPPAASSSNKPPATPPQNNTDGKSGDGFSTLCGDSKADGDNKNTPLKDGEGKPPEPPKQGAPEKYEDFKLPEGMVLDTAMTEKFVGVARELNLSQESAQKLVDFQVDFAKQQSAAIQQQFYADVEAWQKETKQALGSDFEKQLSYVAKAVDRFGGKEFRQLLNVSGMGNRKEMALFLANVGKAISEDSLVTGKTGKVEKSLGEVLFDKM